MKNKKDDKIIRGKKQVKLRAKNGDTVTIKRGQVIAKPKGKKAVVKSGWSIYRPFITGFIGLLLLVFIIYVLVQLFVM